MFEIDSDRRHNLPVTMEALKDIEEIRIETPFGPPSDALIVGTLEGAKVAFLSRHHRNHRLLPSELLFRANIYAMKSLGVEYIISASAKERSSNSDRSQFVVIAERDFAISSYLLTVVACHS